jgi:multiple sugar transport system substrate-binding protein
LVRKLVGATAAVALCAGLAGCLPADRSGPAERPSPSASSEPAAPHVTLRVGVFGDPATLAAYRDLVRRYTAGHLDVSVDVESSPDAASATSRLRSQLQRGGAPDVFLVPHDALPAMVAAHQVQPVDELLEERGVQFGDTYQRAGLEAFSANSALQCMPQDVSPLVVYYNTRLLHLSRMPAGGDPPPSRLEGWTWDQFAAAARQMSHGDVQGVYIDDSLQTLSALVRSSGADVVDDTRRPSTLTMADGDTRTVLQQILAVARDPELAPTARQLRRQDAVTRFENGRLGMIIGTRALTPELRRAEGLQFDVFPIPNFGRYVTQSTMTGYCISANAGDPAAAADFLAYATGHEGASITARPGYVVPASLAVSHAPAFTQPGQQPEHASVFSEAARQSDSAPFVAEWPEVERATQPLLDRIFHARKPDLDTVLQQIDRQSREILARPSATPSP